MQTKRLHLAALFAALATALVPLALYAQSSPWIHVQVQDGEHESVHVNLPLSLARVAAEILPDKVLEKASAKLEENDVSIADIRRLWAELKASGDADLVAVESDDETVHVRREGDLIQVEVQEDKGEHVRLNLPVGVVDALLAGEGKILDLPAAIARLSDHRGDLIQVEDGSDRVHVWIDAKS